MKIITVNKQYKSNTSNKLWQIPHSVINNRIAKQLCYKDISETINYTFTR